MAIGGKIRENSGEFTKKVGLFVGKVIAVNPTEKEYKDVLGMELKENSKAAEYLSERDGNTVLRIDFWVQSTDKKEDDEENRPQKISYFLEDKIRMNKDETKTQYINNIGNCSWAEDEADLPGWFTERDYRKANSGEEDLFEFMRAWLNKLDYRSSDTALELDWKKLMKGNVKDIREQIDGEWAGELGYLAIVITKETDGEVKEYQGIYNRGFVSPYSLKHFRVIDYDNPTVVSALKTKTSKDLKPHERFVLKITGEYGCKDFYILKDIKDYDPSENPVASDSTMVEQPEGGADY